MYKTATEERGVPPSLFWAALIAAPVLLFIVFIAVLDVLATRIKVD
jgi:hypothetical protein